MKKFFSSFLVILLLFCLVDFNREARADEIPSVSVKLKNYIGNQQEVTITVKGTYTIANSNISLVEGKTYTAAVENSSLSLYENNTLLSHFTSFTAVPEQYGTDNYILINNRPYLGSMEFDIENNAYVRPINTLPLEDYLKGVVPFEMMASWNKEALKAQAIAARTYAHRFSSQVIDDTINYQAYGGYSWNINSSLAVDETRSQTLTYNGKLIDALYSASNGGITESNANVWGGTPLAFFPIKNDPYDTKVPWSFNLKKTQIDTTSIDLSNPQNWWSTVKEADPSLISTIKSWMYQNGYANNEIKIASIPILSFSPDKTSGGRVKYANITLQFFLKDKTTGLYVMDENNQIKLNTLTFTDVRATRIRAMMGLNVMKSYLVTNYVDNGSSYLVEGLGNGHGVGMSQWGAKVMADQGFNYQDILEFYYPGTTIANLNPIQVSTAPIVNSDPVGSENTEPAAPAVTNTPVISNVDSSYLQKDNEIFTHYSTNVGVVTTIYVKNSSGKVMGYPVENRNEDAGKHQAIWNVSTLPNGVYTFGITSTDNTKKTVSTTIKVTVNKILAAAKVNSVSDKDSVITGTAEPNVQVTVKAGSKTIGSGKADSKGRLRFSISKQKAGTKLTFTTKDIAGNSKTAMTTVLDKTAPSKPKVNKVTYRCTEVTGTTEANAYLTLKMGSKVYRTSRSDAKGQYKIRISRQRIGATFSITSKDKAGNISAASVFKVSKR